ncbi:triphosphoribosyl-dephospho-CoA synthase CitG [Tetragenococcus osmophilus]|uniref:Probable 2-(5''-triphosphoribosyl)-3'-dephosphocoenzyme-A synthase n=2 Tax=Tetragenococcus osmophilus TaxID=526944 RepID=A0ABN5QZK8_9ENTE|nr:triphosphoribosyl-dephospho-CoA synthase CitG [Tetragenococcus osmophilus]
MQLTKFATKSLYYEVTLSPKPGLVDRFDNGAHQDMDFFMFIDSIESLAPYFYEYARLGFEHHGDLASLFTKLRHKGIEAERDMLEATYQINTHKGANFSFAVLLGATGFYLQEHSLPFSFQDTANVLSLVSQMTQHLVQQDFSHITQKNDLSHGEKLYIKTGVLGVRGEATQGYPALSNLLLPFLRDHTGQENTEVLLLRGLILLVSQIEDSNLLHRGGVNGWQQVKQRGMFIHESKLNEYDFRQSLTSFNQELIEKNLSPGGAADLLSLGIYFSFLEELI